MLNLLRELNSATKELEVLRENVQKASISLEASHLLTKQREKLVQETTDKVYQKYYGHQSDSQNSHNFSDFIKTKCERDIRYFLKLLIYGLVEGNTDIIDEGLLGLKEAYQALTLSSNCTLEALNCLKLNHNLPEKYAKIVDFYIDYIIISLGLKY